MKARYYPKNMRDILSFQATSHYLQRNSHCDEIVVVIPALTDKQMNGYLEEMGKIYISSIILYKPKRISKIFKMVIDSKHITLILEKSMNRLKIENGGIRYKFTIKRWGPLSFTTRCLRCCAKVVKEETDKIIDSYK